mmetsp:Transcript_20389/g.30332  ORF Transcript_20389/g.30332 Transcript_20389/m.30332 type:complete len:96 (-) Transcript_20389:114-401(-)
MSLKVVPGNIFISLPRKIWKRESLGDSYKDKVKTVPFMCMHPLDLKASSTLLCTPPPYFIESLSQTSTNRFRLPQQALGVGAMLAVDIQYCAYGK